MILCMIGPVYVNAFSLTPPVFLTFLIRPGLLLKHSLLVGLVFSNRLFFLTIGDPPLDCGLNNLEVYFDTYEEGPI